jgi:ubiquinone/menaquinone biosynthesis C-methylase UbiE
LSSAPFSAADLHKRVPPDWYEQSVKVNFLQGFWHRRRIAEVTKFSEIVSGEVLDIGSADGYFTKAVYDVTKPNRLIGIDVLKSSVAYASRRYKKIKNLVFRIGDAEKLAFPADKFTAVYILEALEHVRDAKIVLSEIYRVLKPGGFTIILVPSENWLFKIGWPVWTHTRGSVWHETHLNFFDGSKLPQLVGKCGFTDIQTHYFILGMLLLVKARKPAR